MRCCSYKFHRLFPLSQDDLPTHRPDILSFSRPTRKPVAQQITARPSVASFANLPPSTPMVERKTLRFGLHSARMMTADQVALNPEVEYTRRVTSPPLLHMRAVAHVAPRGGCAGHISSPSCFRMSASSRLKARVIIDVQKHPEIDAHLIPGVSQYLVGMFAG